MEICLTGSLTCTWMEGPLVWPKFGLKVGSHPLTTAAPAQPGVCYSDLEPSGQSALD